MDPQRLLPFLSALLILSCSLISNLAPSSDEAAEDSGSVPQAATPETTVESVVLPPPPGGPTELIQPENIVYQGAFLLPPGDENSDWTFSGYAMTFYPDGDSAGDTDGYPGSLYALGHDHQQMVSEVSIPAPVISADPTALNTATTLQPFTDITSASTKRF